MQKKITSVFPRNHIFNRGASIKKWNQCVCGFLNIIISEKYKKHQNDSLVMLK